MITVRSRVRWQGVGVKGINLRLSMNPDCKFNLSGEELTYVIEDSSSAYSGFYGYYYFNTEHPEDLQAPPYRPLTNPCDEIEFSINERFRRSVIDAPNNNSRYAAPPYEIAFKFPPKSVLNYPTYRVFDVGWLYEVTTNPELLTTPRPFSIADQNITTFGPSNAVGGDTGTRLQMAITANPLAWPLIWQPEWQSDLDPTWKPFDRPAMIFTDVKSGAWSWFGNLTAAEASKPSATFTIRAFYIPNPSIKSTDTRSFFIA